MGLPPRAVIAASQGDRIRRMHVGNDRHTFARLTNGQNIGLRPLRGNRSVGDSAATMQDSSGGCLLWSDGVHIVGELESLW